MNGLRNHPPGLTFLKLGGSLITNKEKPRTLRQKTLARLAEEISAAVQLQPSFKLVIGHGAGSFGHVSAKQHGTRQGVRNREQWLGFSEVWWDAAVLNRLVVAALRAADLPAIALPPSAAVVANNGKVERWDLEPLESALEAGLLPVIHGDVIFDLQRGGTILSTEDLFAHLAGKLHPDRLLLAGMEPGVWQDFPGRTTIIPKISPQSFRDVVPAIGGSSGTDVTGGMHAKVKQCVELARALPGMEILIFSAEQSGTLQEILLGASSGTVISGLEA